MAEVSGDFHATEVECMPPVKKHARTMIYGVVLLLKETEVFDVAGSVTIAFASKFCWISC
eukprot:1161015-Pelagomonas_calceolata.AAC.1